MNAFLNYIIEAGISLGIFTLIYWFILRSETRFKATRFYLLVALLFSTLLPFLTIKLDLGYANLLGGGPAEEPPLPGILLESVTIYAAGIPAKMSKAILSFDYSMLIYQLGAMSAFAVIVLGFFQLFRMVSHNRVFRLKRTHLVVSEKEVSPYSFFNFIFIGKALTEQKNWKTMVQHELVHVKQGHTFDVLFVDIMMVFQWFNPFYWILRRLVRENHEFLADTAVLSKGHITGARYKELLLSQAIGGHPVMTSNFLNVKMIQKRFKMITNNRNKKFGFIKYTLGVVVALVLALTFACEDVDRGLEGNADASIIYLGKIISQSELNDLNLKMVSQVQADPLEVLTIYPELKGKLDKDKYTLAFDIQDREQMKIMAKLGVKSEDGIAKIGEVNATAVGKDTAEDKKEEIFIIVEEMPEFPGGELALREFLADHLKYPETAKQEGIQGRVYVSFVVGKDGYVKNAKIARGVDPSLDQEALRVVSNSPKWKPGYQRGVPVSVAYTVPIDFKLQ